LTRRLARVDSSSTRTVAGIANVMKVATAALALVWPVCCAAGPHQPGLRHYECHARLGSCVPVNYLAELNATLAATRSTGPSLPQPGRTPRRSLAPVIATTAISPSLTPSAPNYGTACAMTRSLPISQRWMRRSPSNT
jgi:hypothetical protein